MRFRLITDQASDMISVHDRDGRSLFMSPAVKSILGYDQSTMIGRRPHDFASEDDHAALDRYSVPRPPQRARFGLYFARSFAPR